MNTFSKRPEKIIAVDLDGTLTLTDTLLESVMQVLRDRPLLFCKLPVWLLKGKAHLKSKIAGLIQINPASLPYNDQVIA